MPILYVISRIHGSGKKNIHVLNREFSCFSVSLTLQPLDSLAAWWISHFAPYKCT